MITADTSSMMASTVAARNHRMRRLSLMRWFALAVTVAGLPYTAARAASGQKTVVLVHGAFADGSSWDKVIPLLQAKGLKVVAVQNPLTSLADDVAATKRVLDDQTAPVILVGHSWAGTVITQAGDDSKVAALVFVAAFAPDEGQASADLGKDLPPPPGSASIHPDASGFLYLTSEGVAKNFAQDLPASQTKVMAVTQGPIFGKTFEEKVSTAAWKTKPSWYIVAEKDRMIQPDLERAMAKKIKATTTSLPTSHVPMQSRPKEVAAVILRAADAVSPDDSGPAVHGRAPPAPAKQP
jgi:pimeloyl-ACP methyl ester carboxylesterase